MIYSELKSLRSVRRSHRNIFHASWDFNLTVSQTCSENWESSKKSYGFIIGEYEIKINSSSLFHLTRSAAHPRYSGRMRDAEHINVTCLAFAMQWAMLCRCRSVGWGLHSIPCAMWQHQANLLNLWQIWLALIPCQDTTYLVVMFQFIIFDCI